MFNHLSVLPNRSFNLMEVVIILGQDAYKPQGASDYKIGTQSEPFAVLTELGWVVSGPMKSNRRQNVCHFASTEDLKMAETIQSWWDIETYASKINVVSPGTNCKHKRCLRVRQTLQASGMKWECCGVNQSRTYQTTMAQPWVSFTHWSEGYKGTQILKVHISSQ